MEISGVLEALIPLKETWKRERKWRVYYYKTGSNEKERRKQSGRGVYIRVHANLQVGLDNSHTAYVFPNSALPLPLPMQYRENQKKREKIAKNNSARVT